MIISFNTGKINTTNSGGGNLQQKKVYVTENGLDAIVPDAGYDGMSTLFVKTYVTNDNGLKDYTKIGYSTELNIALNEEIDNNIAEAKVAYETYLKTPPKGNWQLKSYYPNLKYAPAIDTNGITNGERFFYGMSNLELINDYYDWSSNTKLNSAFESCKSLKTLDLSKWDVSNVAYLNNLLTDCSELVSVDLSGWYFPNCTSLSSFFLRCTKLKEIKGIENWNVSNISNISNMFQLCESLTELDLSKWDTSNITTYAYAFKDAKLTTLNISNWVITALSNSALLDGAGGTNSKLIANNLDVSSLTSLSKIFYTTKFTEIDTTGMILPETPDFSQMFYNCSITKIIRGLNVPSTTKSVSNMFYGCSNLEDLYFDNFSSENCTQFTSMFYNCSKLTKIPTLSTKMISDSPFVSTYPMQSIFYNCTKVADFGGFVDCEKITDWGSSTNSPFYYLTSLVNIEQFGTIKGMNFNVSRCTNLSVDSLMVLINALYDYVGNNETPTSTAYSKLTIGSTNLAKLSDEQKAIATSKGWTLA